ncbi:formylglycine-generating enzyme family protein, partial [Myxococcota bacterium]|nr:formylglycine-generating enzyme family protein [Myxococcota bacterium]
EARALLSEDDTGGGGDAPAGYVTIPTGEFTMGSPSGEKGRDGDETPHRVRITRGFYLKATEVTQGEWESVMGSNPSGFTDCGKTCPVENVSWNDAVSYLNKLSDREGLGRCYDASGAFVGLSCKGYRLPTEAEWEYAARAGTTGARHGDLDAVAWYDGNSGSTTHPVGKKRSNAWGLYDMLGNVSEWTNDRYGDYADGTGTDPVGPASGEIRVRRGGSWVNNAQGVRAALRRGSTPDYRSGSLGFRPLRAR